MPQQRGQVGPDGVEHARFARRERMQAIGLHQIRMQRHAFEQERYEGHLKLPGQVRIHLCEAVAGSMGTRIVGDPKPDSETSRRELEVPVIG